MSTESLSESVTPALAVSVKRGASMVSISLSTMWQLIRQGTIPTKKVGNRTLLRVRDLEAFSAGGNVDINPQVVKPEEVPAKAKRDLIASPGPALARAARRRAR